MCTVSMVSNKRTVNRNTHWQQPVHAFLTNTSLVVLLADLSKHSVSSFVMEHSCNNTVNFQSHLSAYTSSKDKNLLILQKLRPRNKSTCKMIGGNRNKCKGSEWLTMKQWEPLRPMNSRKEKKTTKKKHTTKQRKQYNENKMLMRFSSLLLHEQHHAY